MAKERMINTRIWSDNWVTQLDPTEKLLFLYFLTNSYTNISGIYELPIKVAAVETGIDPSMIDKIVPRLRPKIHHHDGWVIIPNFPRYQNTENPKIKAGINNELSKVPAAIHSLAIGYGYPIHEISHPNPNLIKHIGAEAPQVEVVKDEPERVVSKAKYPHKQEVFSAWGRYPKNWEMNVTQCRAAENLYEEHGIEQIIKAVVMLRENSDHQYLPSISTPYELDSKWPKLIKWRNKYGG